MRITRLLANSLLLLCTIAAPVTAQSRFTISFFDRGTFTTIDSDGQVLRQVTPIPEATYGGFFTQSPDGRWLAYNTPPGASGTVMLYDFETGTTEPLFQAPWTSAIGWLPDSPSAFVYGTPFDLRTFDIGTRTSSPWQTGSVLHPFGNDEFRYQPLRWSAARDRVVFLGGRSYGGDNQFYTARPCFVDEWNHLCDVTPLGGPTSWWYTISSPGDITPDGQTAYYTRRTNWSGWSVVKRDIASGEEWTVLEGTDPDGWGIADAVLYGSSHLVVALPSTEKPYWDINVCTLGDQLNCRWVYSAWYPWNLATGELPDKTAPTISVTSPDVWAFVVGQSVIPKFACEDSESGMASCTATLNADGSLDTSTVGHRTWTVTAVDNAGNVAEHSVSYTVGYRIGVLYDQNKVHKAGSTIPIKIQLQDWDGVDLSADGIVVTAVGISKVSDSVVGPIEDASDANPDGNFRFDAGLPGYIYNLGTKGLSTGSYLLHFNCGTDPEAHTVQFQIK